MYSLVTLGSPHLGYMENNSSLLETGNIIIVMLLRSMDSKEMEEKLMPWLIEPR